MLSKEVAMVPQQHYPEQYHEESEAPFTFLWVPGRAHTAEHMQPAVEATIAMGHRAVAVELPRAEDKPTLNDYKEVIAAAAHDYSDVVYVDWSRAEHFVSHAVTLLPREQLVAKIGYCTGGAYGVVLGEPYDSWQDRHTDALEGCFLDMGNGTENPIGDMIAKKMYPRIKDSAALRRAIELLVPVQLLNEDLKQAPSKVEGLACFTFLAAHDEIINNERAAAVAQLSGAEVDWLPTGHVAHLEETAYLVRKVIAKARIARGRLASE